MLAYFHSCSGVAPIVSKLPYQLQEKWTNRAVEYKKRNNVSYHPFPIFANFIREMSKVKNDPGFDYERCLQTSREPSHKSYPPRPVISARKTEVEPSPYPVLGPDKMCPIHRNKHTLNACRAFKAKSIEERRKLLRQKNLCFKCCESDKNVNNACVQDVKCIDCGSSSHPTSLHIVKNESVQASDSPPPPTPIQSLLSLVGCKFVALSSVANLVLGIYL